MKTFCIVYKDKFKIAVKAKSKKQVEAHAVELVFGWLRECRTSEMSIRELRLDDIQPPKNAVKSHLVWRNLPNTVCTGQVAGASALPLLSTSEPSPVKAADTEPAATCR